MNERDKLERASRQPAAERDPSGPPRSVPMEDPILGAFAAVGVGAVVLTGLGLVTSAFVRPCCGATRSARLQWQQRQAEIERVVKQDQAYRQQLAERSAEGIPKHEGQSR